MPAPRRSPKPIARIELFGVVVLKLTRGEGWMIGEPYLRKRDGKPSVMLERRQHVGTDPAAAVLTALGRAQRIMEGADMPRGVDELQSALGGLLAAVTTEALSDPAQLVRVTRQAAGLSRSHLAEKARVSVSTIGRIESGWTARPFAETIARLVAACA